MCMHIYINICKHIYIYLYRCVYKYIYVYMYICEYTNVYVQVCSYFLSVYDVFKCTLYVRVNTSVGAHACMRVRDMSTHTRTLYRVVLEQEI